MEVDRLVEVVIVDVRGVVVQTDVGIGMEGVAGILEGSLCGYRGDGYAEWESVERGKSRVRDDGLDVQADSDQGVESLQGNKHANEDHTDGHEAYLKI